MAKVSSFLDSAGSSTSLSSNQYTVDNVWLNYKTADDCTYVRI